MPFVRRPVAGRRLAVEGRAVIPLDRVFDLDHIQDAHALMESGEARGKLVVTTEQR